MNMQLGKGKYEVKKMTKPAKSGENLGISQVPRGPYPVVLNKPLQGTISYIPDQAAEDQIKFTVTVDPKDGDLVEEAINYLVRLAKTETGSSDMEYSGSYLKLKLQLWREDIRKSTYSFLDQEKKEASFEELQEALSLGTIITFLPYPSWVNVNGKVFGAPHWRLWQFEIQPKIVTKNFCSI